MNDMRFLICDMRSQILKSSRIERGSTRVKLQYQRLKCRIAVQTDSYSKTSSNMRKAFLVLTLILTSVVIKGSDNAPNSHYDTLQNEPISGVYFLNGTIIEYTYDFPWPQWGGEKVIVDTDTTTISFVTTIRMVEEKQDTVQVFGLAGFNASSNRIMTVECESPSNCGYVNFETGSLQFNYSTSAGEFTGTGRLEGGTLTLDTYFEHRGIGIEYDLQGKKIKEGEL